MSPQTSNEDVLISEVFPGGRHYSMLIRAGNTLRFTDIEGGANVALILVNPENTLEKYNMPDTLKGQHTFRLTRGNTLYSDMGRAMAAITSDSFGWHDTATGTCNAALVKSRWGERTYQAARNDYYRNGHGSFLIELGKYGMGRRDLVANLNLFTRIEVTDSGDLYWSDTQSAAGDTIELLFTMDSLAIFHTCPHPMNPATDYPARPVRFEILQGAQDEAADFCRNFRPESERAFTNTRLYRQVKEEKA